MVGGVVRLPLQLRVWTVHLQGGVDQGLIDRQTVRMTISKLGIKIII